MRDADKLDRCKRRGPSSVAIRSSDARRLKVGVCGLQRAELLCPWPTNRVAEVSQRQVLDRDFPRLASPILSD